MTRLRKNLSSSDLSFSKVTEVEKREPRKSFSKPRPHFCSRGRRPRPRNEQAEAEKCFRGSLFSTEVTLEMSNQMWKHFAEDDDMDKKLKQNIFSDFSFFR